MITDTMVGAANKEKIEKESVVPQPLKTKGTDDGFGARMKVAVLFAIWCVASFLIKQALS